jgi:hypothetical protein
MWAEIQREVGRFDMAVVGGIDGSGFPISYVCRPSAELASGWLAFAVEDAPTVTEGPASLLFAKHDERLFKLRSFLLKGNLRLVDREWRFIPTAFVPGMGIGGLASFVRLLRQGRRSARWYLEKRGLSRPKVDWKEVKALLEGPSG